MNENLLSIRGAAKKYELCHVSLSRYVKKRQTASDEATNSLVTMGYRPWNKVFNEEQEKIMAIYIIKAAEIYYGFCPKEVRRFAYELATKYK